MSGVSKLTADKNQRILLELVNQPGNDVCADCKARTPRWASHNLGIFICVNCASIHRKMGTHITKVKSLTLDTWSKEQVEHMKQMGNVKSNSIYNPDETRYPPPTNMIDSERDSELEKYIRAKYEFKSFMKRSPSEPKAKAKSKPVVSTLSPSSSIDRSAAVAALLGPSRSAASRASTISTSRPSTSSISSASASSSTAPTLPPRTAPPLTSTNAPASTPSLPPRSQERSVSQPQPSSAPTAVQGQISSGGALTGSQSQTIDATLPLQVLAPTSAPLAIPSVSPASYLSAPNPFHNLQANSAPAFQSSFGQTTGISPGSIGSGMGVSPGMNAGMSSSYTGTSLSPFQTTTQLSSTPSPNPFSTQMLPNATGAGSFTAQSNMTGYAQQPQTPFGQPSPSPFGQQQLPFSQPNQTPFGQPTQSPFGQAQNPFGQSQTPFSQTQTPFGQPQTQAFGQQQPQMQFAQPQSQMQAPQSGNPYLQTPSPFMTGQQMGGTPSPFQQTQPLPQMNSMQQMQQQQTGFGGTNPFTSWIQQPPTQQQGGYNQQWNM